MKSNSEVREMAVHRMEQQNIAVHEVEMQMAKQKESEMKEKQFKKETEPTLTIKVDTSQLEKAIELINKLIEKSERIQSLADCLKENNYLKKEKQYLDIELRYERLHKKYCICIEILVSIVTTVILTILIQKIM